MTPAPATTSAGAIDTRHPRPVDPALATATAPEPDAQKNKKNFSSIAPGGAGPRRERRLGEIMQQHAETVGKAKGPPPASRYGRIIEKPDDMPAASSAPTSGPT